MPARRFWSAAPQPGDESHRPADEDDMNLNRIIILTTSAFLISTAAQARPLAKPMGGNIPVTQFCGLLVCPSDANGTPAAVAEPVRLRGKRLKGHAGGPTNRSASQRPPNGESGVVRSGKTGATARVSPRFQPIAQAVVDDLEARGATIRFMGGYRKGPCWPGGLHPCGLAIDLCQTARGIVDRRCNLPSRAVEASVAAAHGALSGGIWCHQDRGHIQLGQTAGACGGNLYAAVREYQAKRHAPGRRHHRIRVARR
jgi:hypothetical protein